jgi:Flp pilus assembly protein TadG
MTQKDSQFAQHPARSPARLQTPCLDAGRATAPRQRNRKGATTLETALALSVFVTLILGMVDLGYGVFRQHVLAHSTRQLARQAIVHGALAERTAVWGPDPISIQASQGEEISASIASSLVGWNLEEVEIRMDWIDAGNDARQGHRIRVAMTAPYRPIMTFIFGSPSIQLSATSTMFIAH